MFKTVKINNLLDFNVFLQLFRIIVYLLKNILFNNRYALMCIIFIQIQSNKLNIKFYNRLL